MAHQKSNNLVQLNPKRFLELDEARKRHSLLNRLQWSRSALLKLLLVYIVVLGCDIGSLKLAVFWCFGRTVLLEVEL
jgi:hypothetical protein